jgi:hypothetical protein
MEVGSVSSNSTNTLVASAQAQARVQDQQTQQSQQTQRSQQAQNSQPADERETAAAVRNEAETSRPAVNANGQTVGTRVNTTA